MSNNFVIGIDYGTDSVRAIIVDTANGNEVAAAVFLFPRWNDGLYCDASKNQFRQHPLDHIEGLEATVKDCLQQAGATVRANIKAIAVDATGSTPGLVDKQGTPLALLPEFEHNPNAMFILWKDHTAVKEALEINNHATKFDINYLKYSGGIYSSEWFWSKLLHVLRNDEQVCNAAYTCVENCDWIPFLLTGGKDAAKIKRGVCAAGHKGLWAAAHGGFPPDEFFSSLDPLLKGYVNTLGNEVFTSDKSAGYLCDEWAERLGLSNSIPVGIGAIDAHAGAVGGQIEPYVLSKVMGTSTCDMLVAPENEIQSKVVKGICGQVDGSIIPGMIGMEAGQSAFGDVYAWFKNLLLWPFQNVAQNFLDKEVLKAIKDEAAQNILSVLSKQAAALPINENSELSIDWFNGRRTPDANPLLKGAVTGLTLGSNAPRLFRSLVEATCFGARKITDRFQEEGITVRGLIGVGGIAQKSPYIMQMLASAMNMPIRIHKSEQTCALGAAMYAAVIAGIYSNVEEAMRHMGQGFSKEYTPEKSLTELYNKRYDQYKLLSGKTEEIES